MLSNLLRTSIRRTAPSFRRYVTTDSSQKVASQKRAQLSPEKMRSLISIYHTSEQFITPETLSAAIDAAFIDDHDMWNTIYGRREKFEADLQQDLSDRRLLPKLSSTDSSERPPISMGHNTFSQKHHGNDFSFWSSHKSERELQLKAALYGIEPSGEVPRPGLEVLEEEHERVQRSLKD